MTATKKYGLGLIAILLVICGISIVKLLWFKPFTFHQFLERSYLQLLWNDPEALTQTGLLNDVPFLDFNSRLSRTTLKSSGEMTENGKDVLALLEEYDPEELDENDRISYLIFKWFLQHNINAAEFAQYDYPINQYSGQHTRFPKFMARAHPINDRSDAEDYLSRIAEWPSKVLELIDEMEQRKALGVVPPTGILDQCIVQCGALKQKTLEGDVIYSSFINRIANCSTISTQDSIQLGDKCRKLLFEEVKPAYGRLQEYLVLLRKHSKEIHGVWRFPNGDAYYQQCLEGHTTISVAPNELYETGKMELEKIRLSIMAELAELGYSDSTDLPSMLAQFDADHATSFESTDSGYNHALNHLAEIIELADEQMHLFFHATPKDTLTVERMTPRREMGSPLAYYARTADGLAGTVYMNLSRPADLPYYSMPTLIHHEGIPGHHLQRSIRLSNTDLPSFRRFIPFTSYTEGWAMYAEYLADEMGLITTPQQKIGLLRSDLLRTVRLLCDLGIHHKKWLRDQAIDYLVENAGVSKELASREIDRYIVDPGQGCAYKVGQLKFFELREYMEKELKHDFNLKDFHRIVLENGAMPLPILELVVKQETEKLKAKYQSLVPEPD